jgi:hypothetical protein
MTIQDKMTVLKKVILIIQPTNLIKIQNMIILEETEEGKLDPVVEKEIERVCQMSRRKRTTLSYW